MTGVMLCVLPAVLLSQNPAPSTPAAAPPVTVPGGRTAAQDAAAAAGKTVTNAEIVEAIKNSGLTEGQVRARLQAAGFDAKLADPFFSTGLSSGSSAASNARSSADPGFVNALQSLGIISSAEAEQAKKPDQDENTNKKSPDKVVGTPASGVFGKEVFSGFPSSFDPVAAGPVDASYRLGVGDQLQYVVTGDMEVAQGLEVRRDGTVVLPQVGQVAIAGLTLEAARTLLSVRAGRVYSPIATGKARIDLSVSRVRSNQVFVVGEVERPGAYQLSALATVFRALIGAGGPTTRGTFRNVEVRRGGKIIAHVDLYDYLLNGDASKDIRTEQGDIVFVGLSKRVVAIQGAVRRPGVFEMRDEDGFADLLTFAGGLMATAVTDRIQIDRVLPPAERSPGRERAVIDVPFNGNYALLDTVHIYPNDLVSVFAVGDIRRNQVTLIGEVFQPGIFEWSSGLTAGGLIQKAQGFMPWALTDRIKVQRPISSTGHSEIFSLNAKDTSFAKFPIEEFDVVTVLDGRRAFPSGTVTISGAVYSPGATPYSENESLGDLIDVANGFRQWALKEEVKLTRTDVTTGRKTLLSFDMGVPASRRFVLQPSDEVMVLDARLQTVPARVTIAGAVITPASYPFAEHQTVKDLIDLAGGFKAEAAGVELASRRLAANYSDTSSIVRTFSILPGGRLDNGGDTISLARGDYVTVRDSPGFRQEQETVTLSGLFKYPGVYVLRRDGERLKDVVERAGGLLPSAYPASGRLMRLGRPVAIDLALALRGESTHNIQLDQGDQLSVGVDPSVVYITGAVERQTVVPYHKGWSTLDYINAAGGFTEDAAQGNIILEYPSGEIRRQVKHWFSTTGDMTVVSGSTVSVGRKPEEKPSSGSEVLAKTLQVTATIVSLFLAYKTATR